MIWRHDFLIDDWIPSSPEEMRIYLQQRCPVPPITDEQLAIMVERMEHDGYMLFNVPDPFGEGPYLYTDKHFEFRWSEFKPRCQNRNPFTGEKYPDEPPPQGEKGK